MDSDQPIRSPAQRAMRCRAALLALAFLGMGASRLNEVALADIFRWSWTDGKVFNTGRHAISMAADGVVTSSTTTGSNSAAAAVPALVTSNLPDTAVKSTGRLTTSGKLQTAGN